MEAQRDRSENKRKRGTASTPATGPANLVLQWPPPERKLLHMTTGRIRGSAMSLRNTVSPTPEQPRIPEPVARRAARAWARSGFRASPIAVSCIDPAFGPDLANFFALVLHAESCDGLAVERSAGASHFNVDGEMLAVGARLGCSPVSYEGQVRGALRRSGASPANVQMIVAFLHHLAHFRSGDLYEIDSPAEHDASFQAVHRHLVESYALPGVKLVGGRKPGTAARRRGKRVSAARSTPIAPGGRA